MTPPNPLLNHALYDDLYTTCISQTHGSLYDAILARHIPRQQIPYKKADRARLLVQHLIDEQATGMIDRRLYPASHLRNMGAVEERNGDDEASGSEYEGDDEKESQSESESDSGGESDDDEGNVREDHYDPSEDAVEEESSEDEGPQSSASSDESSEEASEDSSEEESSQEGGSENGASENEGEESDDK